MGASSGRTWHRDVIVIRLDGMERLVEDRGRPATSLVLRELGRHITSVLRPLDLVGQLDDERLAVVCAGVDEETTVVRIAERIRAVARRPIGAGGLPLVPSVGATCSASGQRRPAALLQAALEAADDRQRSRRRRDPARLAAPQAVNRDSLGPRARRAVHDPALLGGRARNPSEGTRPGSASRTRPRSSTSLGSSSSSWSTLRRS